MHLRWQLATVVVAAVLGHASYLKPNAVPLIVRNPYLSAWLGHAREEPWKHWPIFWTGDHLGLAVMASVPDTKAVYPLLGRPQDSLSDTEESYHIKYPIYLGTQFDASTTNLTYRIDGHGDETVIVVLSFLSPITPSSTFRQSIPASYLTIEVSGDFDISVYIDMNGEWTSASRESHIVWELHETDDLKTFKTYRRSEELFTENVDRSEWGSLHLTAPSETAHEAGTSGLLRSGFAEKGTLQNAVDGNFRRIMEDEPVFAFAKTFKLSGGSGEHHGSGNTQTLLITIAHIQDPIVQYASARGLTHARPLWTSYEDSPDSLLEWHYHDYPVALALASNYSAQLEIDALESGSHDYRDILALSARQVIGASSFSGTPENPLIFFKEISSDGNVNTVDVIYPAFPFFLYTNPRWLAYLLEPLLEHQMSGQYPNDYSMHDIGSSFPNATGHADGRDEYMPVEECGNMLIMALALVNAFKYNYKMPSLWYAQGHDSGRDVTPSVALYIDEQRMDDSGPIDINGHRQARKWIEKSYRVLKQWTGYLVRESLIPKHQLSTDDFAGWLANQTNLAIKGIVGIRAMAELSATIGETDDAYHYLNTSEEYFKTWHEELAMSRDGTHAKLAYNWYGSWTLLYNMFADSLLCFHLPSSSSFSFNFDGYNMLRSETAIRDSKTAFIPSSVYKAQSDWYYNVRQKYGIPLDSRHTYTKSDWEFFAVATASKKVREEVIDSVATWVNETDCDRPFTDGYETESGSYPEAFIFKARPVVGGHFAYMALERACGGEATKALAFLDEEPQSHGPKVDYAWDQQQVLSGREDEL